MSWTEERVETLKKLWSDGLSASQIAAELCHVSRNAVIGKVHRLGLSGRATTVSRRHGERRPRPARAVTMAKLRAASAPVAGALALAPVGEPEIHGNVIPFSQRRTFAELNSVSCRWPVGDPVTPDFFFCGGYTAEGFSYCPYHTLCAYQPAGSGRRDRRPFRG